MQAAKPRAPFSASIRPAGSMTAPHVAEQCPACSTDVSANPSLPWKHPKCARCKRCFHRRCAGLATSPIVAGPTQLLRPPHLPYNLPAEWTCLACTVDGLDDVWVPAVVTEVPNSGADATVAAAAGGLYDGGVGGSNSDGAPASEPTSSLAFVAVSVNAAELPPSTDDRVVKMFDALEARQTQAHGALRGGGGSSISMTGSEGGSSWGVVELTVSYEVEHNLRQPKFFPLGALAAGDDIEVKAYFQPMMYCGTETFVGIPNFGVQERWVHGTVLEVDRDGRSGDGVGLSLVANVDFICDEEIPLPFKSMRMPGTTRGGVGMMGGTRHDPNLFVSGVEHLFAADELNDPSARTVIMARIKMWIKKNVDMFESDAHEERRAAAAAAAAVTAAAAADGGGGLSGGSGVEGEALRAPGARINGKDDGDGFAVIDDAFLDAMDGIPHGMLAPPPNGGAAADLREESPLDIQVQLYSLGNERRQVVAWVTIIDGFGQVPDGLLESILTRCDGARCNQIPAPWIDRNRGGPGAGWFGGASGKHAAHTPRNPAHFGE